MRTLQKCYQFRLHPTPQQECLFRQMAGCRRLVWNHFRERRQTYYQQTGKTLSFAGMCQELTLLKQHPDRDSIAMKRRSCGWNDDFMMEVLRAFGNNEKKMSFGTRAAAL